jgi:hypothetical protein
VRCSVQAFRAVDVGQPHGLVTPLQFSKVCTRASTTVHLPCQLRLRYTAIT